MLRIPRIVTAWKFGLLVLTLLNVPLIANGQFMPGNGPGQQRQQMYLPPPLNVRFSGPTGMRVTFYDGVSQPRAIAAPLRCVFRPGYVFRIKISDMKEFPGVELFPTLEVRGSLNGGGKLDPNDFPATIRFTEDEVARVRDGALVTKVVFLERQDRAAPVATSANMPLEYKIPPDQDLLMAASQYGTPLVIIRIGQREISEEALQQQAIPGTVQLAEGKVLGIPKSAPYLPWACPSLYDPRLGPDSQASAICLPDGGDSRTKAGVLQNGEIVGLDPSDTVASYVDSQGRRKLAVSNRVCICVPRFVVFRTEMELSNRVSYTVPGSYQIVRGGAVTKNVVPTLVNQQAMIPQKIETKQSVSTVVATQGTVVFGQVNGIEILVNVKGIKGVSGVCVTPDAEPVDIPMLLVKWPDKCGAAIGDTITFTLKYTNQGGRPIQNVVVTDNLVTRYEYVPGSQQTDRAGTFTTQPNEEGSTVLRWEMNDELPPGASGVIRFQVKVR